MLAVAGDALGCLSEEKDTIRGGHIKLKTLGKGERREEEGEGDRKRENTSLDGK